MKNGAQNDFRISVVIWETWEGTGGGNYRTHQAGVSLFAVFSFQLSVFSVRGFGVPLKTER
jgi:hypothetical protein